MKNDFRSSIQIKRSEHQITHADSLLLLGSCFSENIGEKLTLFKFNTLINPLGISYNPISIHQLLSEANPPGLQIEEKEGIYFHHGYHSSMNKADQLNFEENLNSQKKLIKEQIQQKGFLILTYGTAWVYELVENGAIVNNCQKEAAKKFRKRMLSATEILTSWKETHEQLAKINPALKIIFTISPVRHIKDGIRENQLSKSLLHLAVDTICEEYSNCSYFPSYEIMMDDLRDYRFYKEDLIHPNQQAINYIWDCFGQTYFNEESNQINEQITKILRSLNHRPFQPNSLKHREFLTQLAEQIKSFQQNRQLDFSIELSQIQGMLD